MSYRKLNVLVLFIAITMPVLNNLIIYQLSQNQSEPILVNLDEKSKLSNFDIPQENNVWLLAWTYSYEYQFKRNNVQVIGENNIYISIYQMKRGPTYDFSNDYDYFAVTVIHQMVPGWSVSSDDVNVQMKDKAEIKYADSALELGRYGPLASEGTSGSSTQFTIEGTLGQQGEDPTISVGIGFAIGSSYAVSEVAIEDHSSFSSDIFNVYHNFNNGAGNAARSTKNVYPAFIIRTPQRNPYQTCHNNPYLGWVCSFTNPRLSFQYSIEATFGHQYLWFWLYDTTSQVFTINFPYSPAY